MRTLYMCGAQRVGGVTRLVRRTRVAAAIRYARRQIIRMRKILIVLIAACGSSDDGGTSVSGQAVYRDSATDHTGAQHAAASPSDQDMNITMTIKGTGTIPNVDAQCITDPTGRFEAHYSG